MKATCLGNHPLWEICRAGYQIDAQAFTSCGFALVTGYLWAMSRGLERSLSPEAVRFQRREQMQRLSRFVRGNRSVGNVKPSSDCA